MDEPDKILIIRLKSIGDIVLTLPAVHLVRDNFPRAEITFLTSRENALLLEGFGPVDEVVAVDRDAFRRANLTGLCRQSIDLVRDLRRRKLSIAVDFQVYGETAVLTWLTGAPRRWASVDRRTRAWAYTRRVPLDGSIHPAERHRSLLARCGLGFSPVCNEFSLPPRNLEEARAVLAERGCDPARPRLYLQPFTSSPQKDWPLEKYLALARFWQARKLQVVFGGGPSDLTALEPARAEGFTVLAGVPRMTYAGLMKLSTVVVGGDTGFLHLAVAMGKRVVMLMNSVGPGSAVPLGHPDWVIAPPGGHSLATVAVEEVIKATAAPLDAERVRGKKM